MVLLKKNTIFGSGSSFERTTSKKFAEIFIYRELLKVNTNALAEWFLNKRKSKNEQKLFNFYNAILKSKFLSVCVKSKAWGILNR